MCWDEYEADEYYAEKQIYDDIEAQAKTEIWTTKDGNKIPVRKMTTSHIQNTINLIKRRDKYDYYLPWLRVFEAELQERSKRNDRYRNKSKLI